MDIPFTLITAVTSGIKSATDIVEKLSEKVKDARVLKEINELLFIISSLNMKILELQNSIFSLHKENLDLKNQIEACKARKIEDKQWRKTAERYCLISLGAGTQVYAYQPRDGDATPPHYLCASCFQEKKKSILQKTGYNHLGAVYKCHPCGQEVIDYSDKPNDSAYSIPRRDPYPGY